MKQHTLAHPHIPSPCHGCGHAIPNCVHGVRLPTRARRTRRPDCENALRRPPSLPSLAVPTAPSQAMRQRFAPTHAHSNPAPLQPGPNNDCRLYTKFSPSCFEYDHSFAKVPELVRSQKPNACALGQYYRGGPGGKPGCCIPFGHRLASLVVFLLTFALGRAQDCTLPTPAHMVPYCTVLQYCSTLE